MRTSGYGLPIGGVLATENAVIPYAVGVDIACRMKLTVYDRKANIIAGQRDRLANIIESETRFGMGCEFKERRDHDVMDEDWTRFAGDAAPARQGVDAARHQRQRKSLRRVRRVHRDAMKRWVLPDGRIPRAAQSLGFARHRRAGLRYLQQARDGPPLRTCRRNSSTSRGSRSMRRMARNTGTP